MSRYVNELPLQCASDTVFNGIYSFLLSEGYEYTQYKNETVFKKGLGFMSGPSFVKVSFTDKTVRVEAWIKFAILPGVYAGEMDLNGFVGIAVKAPLKYRVQQVETIIMNNGVLPMANGQVYNGQPNNGQIPGGPNYPAQ